MEGEELRLALVLFALVVVGCWWGIRRDLKLKHQPLQPVALPTATEAVTRLATSGLAGSTYLGGAALTWFLIFVGAWIYCIATYGFLLGVGLGWLAAGIAATVLCWFWPLYLLGAIGLAIFIFGGR